MTHRLKKKVALVTGASSGIGRATALAFAREGADVVAVGRRKLELEKLVREHANGGGRLVAHAADVTNEEKIAGAVAFAVRELGGLHVAVNAAGGSFPGGLTHELDADAFRAWLEGHLVSAFLSTKHELRAMLESGGGSIVNVGTFVGETKMMPGTSGYAAAKTGLVGFTRTVAAEYAMRNVRANVMIVGGTDTPMFRAWNATTEARAAAAGLHALGRVADASEIAAAALFLASDDASFVTGTTLTVDGGVSIA